MHPRCQNFHGLFTTRVIKSHVKIYTWNLTLRKGTVSLSKLLNCECEYSKHKALRVRKATGTFKKQAPADIWIVKGIIVYLTKSCLLSYGRKHLILRSKPSVCKIKLYPFHALTAWELNIGHMSEKLSRIWHWWAGHRLQAVSYFSLQSYCTRNPITQAAKPRWTWA